MGVARGSFLLPARRKLVSSRRLTILAFWSPLVLPLSQFPPSFPPLYLPPPEPQLPSTSFTLSPAPTACLAFPFPSSSTLSWPAPQLLSSRRQSCSISQTLRPSAGPFDLQCSTIYGNLLCFIVLPQTE